MLHLRSATLTFGDRTLFSGLDLTVGQGQLVGIAGESGCGKTSLLRAILGFVPLSAGSIEVCGLPLDVHHVNEIRRRTAYVPQELQPPVQTGRDLIALTHDLSHNHASPSSVSYAATLSQLQKSLSLSPDLLTLEAAKLSGGQRLRILLAAALALKPLLMLDEPTSALDEDSTQRVGLALLRACHDEDGTAIVVSHDPVLLAFCDKVVSLSATTSQPHATNSSTKSSAQ